MPLSETRIVLFEKFELKNLRVAAMLDDIEVLINISERGNNKSTIINSLWLKHRLIRKILKENRYRITICYNGNPLRGLISWD